MPTSLKDNQKASTYQIALALVERKLALHKHHLILKSNKSTTTNKKGKLV